MNAVNTAELRTEHGYDSKVYVVSILPRFLN